MSNDESPVPGLVAIDRRQLLLRTVDVERLGDDASIFGAPSELSVLCSLFSQNTGGWGCA